jgi:hypothetical protein
MDFWLCLVSIRCLCGAQFGVNDLLTNGIVILAVNGDWERRKMLKMGSTFLFAISWSVCLIE